MQFAQVQTGSVVNTWGEYSIREGRLKRVCRAITVLLPRSRLLLW